MSWQVGPIRSLFAYHHAQRTDFVHTNPILLGLVIKIWNSAWKRSAHRWCVDGV